MAYKGELEHGASQQSDSAGVWFLFVLFVIPLVGYVHRLIINIMIDPISIELAISETQASLLQGMPFAIVYGVLLIPMGLLADRANRVLMLSSGTILWSLGTLMCGLAPSFSILFGAFMVIGLGQAVIIPCVVSLVGDRFAKERRGLAMGVFFIGVNAGYSLAYAVGGALLGASRAGLFDIVPIVGDLSPWRQSFIVAALPGFLLPLLLATVREPTRHDSIHSEGVLQPLRSLFSNKPLAILLTLLIAHSAILMVADSGIYAWQPRLLSRGHGVSPTELGLVLGAIIAVAGLLGGPIGGGLSDLFIKRSGISGSAFVFFLSTLGVLIAAPLFGADSKYVVYCAVAIWVVAIIANSTAALTFISLVVPNRVRGVTSSISVAIGTLVGFSLGPSAIALALDFVAKAPDRVDIAIVAVALPASVIAAVLALLVWRLSSGLKSTEAEVPV